MKNEGPTALNPKSKLERMHPRIRSGGRCAALYFYQVTITSEISLEIPQSVSLLIINNFFRLSVALVFFSY